MAKTRIAPDPNVGRNIAALMDAHVELGSQPTLAKRTGVAQSTIGRIIRGESNATGENLRKIANAYGVDVGVLYHPHEKFKEHLRNGTLTRVAAELGDDHGPEASRSISTMLAGLCAVLTGLPPSSRHRVADMLSALALAPDSGTLQESIVTELTGSAVPVSVTPSHTESSTFRKQAVRLAEVHPDSKARALLSEFIGKVDVVMRGDPDGDPSPAVRKPTKNKG